MRLSVTKSFKTFPNKKNPSHPEYVTQKVYKEINDTFNILLFESLLATGEEFNLPERLGSLQLVKFKPKNPSIDFAATKAIGQKVVHDNLHSDGYAVKLKWKKDNANFKGKKMWDFKLVRHHIRLNPISIKNHIMKHGVGNFMEDTFYHAHS